jgi:hypothetical protein
MAYLQRCYGGEKALSAACRLVLSRRLAALHSPTNATANGLRRAALAFQLCHRRQRSGHHYAIDGKHDIAVAAGGSSRWGYAQVDAVIVFGLR